MLKFDFGIVDDENILICLVEYDGQYHYQIIDGDIDSYNTIKEHDKRKNEYCDSNDIRLIRIGFEFYNIIPQILALEFNIDGYEEDLMKKSKKDIINYYNYKIKKLEGSQ